jgi:hypothetical protein
MATATRSRDEGSVGDTGDGLSSDESDSATAGSRCPSLFPNCVLSE